MGSAWQGKGHTCVCMCVTGRYQPTHGEGEWVREMLTAQDEHQLPGTVPIPSPESVPESRSDLSCSRPSKNSLPPPHTLCPKAQRGKVLDSSLWGSGVT